MFFFCKRGITTITRKIIPLVLVDQKSTNKVKQRLLLVGEVNTRGHPGQLGQLHFVWHACGAVLELGQYTCGRAVQNDSCSEKKKKLGGFFSVSSMAKPCHVCGGSDNIFSTSIECDKKTINAMYKRMVYLETRSIFL